LFNTKDVDAWTKIKSVLLILKNNADQTEFFFKEEKSHPETQ
jgi:hypothetical protein